MRSPRSRVERGDAAAEIIEARGELADGGSLVDMRVPAAGFGERDLEPDVGLHQLRDLAQRLAVAGARVLRAVLGLVLLRIGGLEHPDRVEGLAAGFVQDLVGGGGVFRFERRLHHLGRLSGANPELADLADGQCGRGALQRARQLAGQRHGAKRRGFGVLPRVQVAVEPAVLRALHARRRRLHVVLRVEMRTRAVRRTGRMDDRELLRVPERLQRRETRMEAEEPVEIDRRVIALPGCGIAMLGRAA